MLLYGHEKQVKPQPICGGDAGSGQTKAKLASPTFVLVLALVVLLLWRNRYPSTFARPAGAVGTSTRARIDPAVTELMNNDTTRSLGVKRVTFGRPDKFNAPSSLRLHLPEYVMEAGEMATYMFFACAFVTLVQHPASPIRHLIASALIRRALAGVGVGATVIVIIMTPWGKQSGGHFNPAVTFTFYRLGKVKNWDAVFYGIAQFFGATLGVAIATYVLQGLPKDSAVHYAVTVPGVYGGAVAFVAELGISFGLMLTILFVTNRKTIARYTPYFVGGLYAIYITFEAPLSGMSMNPARTFGSAFQADYWRAMWIYFLAPTVGMLIAAEVFLRIRGGVGPYCAKLHHANSKPCIFIHGYRTAPNKEF